MFLRKTQRKKDGKTHEYWSVVENKRVAGGGVVQRHVLYLGEINSSQAAGWRKAIEVLDDDVGLPRTLALFPEDRCAAVASDASIVQLRLSDMRLCRPRQWGACWLAGQLWRDLRLDQFWAERLPPNRKGTRWDQVLQVLVSYRLIAPGSEWKLHRDWFGRSAMARPYVAPATVVDFTPDLDDVRVMFLSSRQLPWPSTSCCPPPPVR